MATLAFKQLPLAVKVAVWFVFNNVWWSIEEFVIDRKGLWKYMAGLQGSQRLCMGPGGRANYFAGDLARLNAERAQRY